MLTLELLKGNSNLSGLTDEQLNAITELSKNDENAVIAAKVKEIHSSYDADIESITGQAKPPTLRTYEHLKTVLSDLKGKAGSAEQLTAQLNTLKSEKSELEKQIKAGGGDVALKAQLSQLEQTLADKEQRITELAAAKETTVNEYAEKLKTAEQEKQGILVGFEFQKALAGVKFKDSIPESVANSYTEAQKSRILSEYTPAWIDDGKGGKMLAFRNKDGQIANNPDNNLNPFTAAELLQKGIAEIVQPAQQRTGTGGTGGGAGSGNTDPALTAAKTQTEFISIVQNSILEQGIAKTSPKFIEEQNKIVEEHKEIYSELPTR